MTIISDDCCYHLHLVSDELRPSHQAADAVSSALQLAQKAAAPIAGCPAYQDEPSIRNNSIPHGKFVQMKDVSDNGSAQRNEQVPGIYSRVIFFLSDMFRSIYYLPDYICGHVFIEHES